MRAFVAPLPLPTSSSSVRPPRHLSVSRRVHNNNNNNNNSTTLVPRASAVLKDAPDTPAEWLRKHDPAIPRPDNAVLINSVVTKDRIRPARAARPQQPLYLPASQPWLYSGPPAYCNIAANLDDLVALLQNKVFYLGPVTRNKVVRAVQLARDAVGVRSGVLLHNITVALVVADLQMDCDTVCAAVLRDIVSRPGCTNNDVERHVGADVLHILEHHQHITNSVNLCVDSSFTEISFSNLRELILVDAFDEHRAISLELARAVLTMRKIDTLQDDETRRAEARKAMYLYAPLANQLGIWFVQGELEELAFMYLQPESYHMIRHLVGERRRECDSTLAQAKEFLERILTTDPDVRSLVRTVLIKGRVKGLYSVYRKMRRSGKKVAEIYDLLALRVVIQPKRADDESEKAACYAVAEVIKRHYQTLASRAKDYIANPKRNGYRSLHLTVIPNNSTTPLEIQIRTDRMHHVAEFGAAAHWIYKEENSKGSSNSNHGKGNDGTNAYVSACNNAQSILHHNFGSVQAQVSYDRPRLRSDNVGLVTISPRVGRDDPHERMRKGYVTCLASAIRTSRVIVAAAGQLYALTVGSTLLDLAAGMGVAERIAMVNGTVAPLTQVLKMNDIVMFIASMPEA